MLLVFNHIIQEGDFDVPVSLKIWWQAIRPRTLIAAISPVLIGGIVSAHIGSINWFIWLTIFLAALFIQIGTNLANDYYDFIKGSDTGDRVGPVRVTQSGRINPKTVLRAAWTALFIALLLGIILVLEGGVPILVIGTLSLLLALAYTAGPFPLAYLGIADLFVLVFFGPVAVWGTVYLLLGESFAPAILIGLGPGAISTALLTVNNLRDVVDDKLADKKTLIVRFGIGFGKFEYFGLLLIALLVPVVLYFNSTASIWILLTLLTPLFVAKTLKIVAFENGESLNSALVGTGQFLFLYTLIISLGWIL